MQNRVYLTAHNRELDKKNDWSMQETRKLKLAEAVRFEEKKVHYRRNSSGIATGGSEQFNHILSE